MVKASPSRTGGVGLIPGQGTKIPHTLCPKGQDMKQKQCCGKFNKVFKKWSTLKKKIFRNKQKGSPPARTSGGCRLLLKLQEDGQLPTGVHRQIRAPGVRRLSPLWLPPAPYFSLGSSTKLGSNLFVCQTLEKLASNSLRHAVAPHLPLELPGDSLPSLAGPWEPITSTSPSLSSHNV